MTCKVCGQYFYTKKVYDDGMIWAYKDKNDRFVFVLKEHSDSFPTCSGAHQLRRLYEHRFRPDPKSRKKLQQVIVDGHLVVIESDISTLHC